jgi:hypothetical protein
MRLGVEVATLDARRSLGLHPEEGATGIHDLESEEKADPGHAACERSELVSAPNSRKAQRDSQKVAERARKTSSEPSLMELLLSTGGGV